MGREVWERLVPGAGPGSEGLAMVGSLDSRRSGGNIRLVALMISALKLTWNFICNLKGRMLYGCLVKTNYFSFSYFFRGFINVVDTSLLNQLANHIKYLMS